MVGVGFPERNDSFDFIAGLDDFKKQYRIAKGTQVPAAINGQGKDFTLKQGETISIKIPGVTTGKKTEHTANLLGATGGGLKKLAPPPGSKKSVPVVQ